MPKAAKTAEEAAEEVGVVFVDDLPLKGSTTGNRWIEILQPLLKKPGRWALLRTYDQLEQAENAQGNLTKRNALIPYPDHDWTFAARGVDLYGKYDGPKRKRR